jgi:hypothetical protein
MQKYELERKSPLTGKVNSMEIEMNPADYLAWKQGELIQNALPYLSADEREFIKTGITASDWNTMYPEKTEA